MSEDFFVFGSYLSIRKSQICSITLNARENRVYIYLIGDPVPHAIDITELRDSDFFDIDFHFGIDLRKKDAKNVLNLVKGDAEK